MIKFKEFKKFILRKKLLFVVILILLSYTISLSLYRHFKKDNDPNLSNLTPPASRYGSVVNVPNQPKSYTLIIDQLKISAPIILNVNGSDKKTYLAALVNGVAQMAGSALPGGSGNTVIFGHSSFWADKPGNYKTVFAHLNKLKRGDTISIKNGNQVLNYSVAENKIVSPTDVSVINQDLSQHLLTLITCWPPGTIDQRLVVVAKMK